MELVELSKILTKFAFRGQYLLHVVFSSSIKQVFFCVVLFFRYLLQIVAQCYE